MFGRKGIRIGEDSLQLRHDIRIHGIEGSAYTVLPDHQPVGREVSRITGKILGILVRKEILGNLVIHLVVRRGRLCLGKKKRQLGRPYRRNTVLIGIDVIIVFGTREEKYTAEEKGCQHGPARYYFCYFHDSVFLMFISFSK